MKRISVVIPVYKSVYLPEALDSVFRQTHRVSEIVIVDSSPEITLQQIGGYLDQIRHIPQPPCGVSSARNVGIKAASEEYVALLDADDLWLPEKLHIQLSLLESYPEAEFCFSTTWNLIEGANSLIPSEPYRPAELRSWIRSHSPKNGAVCGDVRELLFSVNCVATSSVVARKTSMVKAGLFDESFNNGEDYDFWLRLATLFSAIYVCEPTSRYRVHANGLSGNWASRSELFYKTNIRVLEKHLASRRSSLTVRSALSRILAEFANFQVKSGDLDDAKKTVLQSLRVLPNLEAMQTFIEITFPKAYSIARSLVINVRALS
jgi:glycosyltransferase involved in cell wall biosynthesis